MEPLKITFNLVGDMVYPTMPLHLDALLAYAVTQDNLVTLDEGASHEDLLALGDNLPIERHIQDGKWVYKASALMPDDNMTHSRYFFTQRQDLDDMVRRAAKGEVHLGRYKGEPLEPMSHKMKLDLTRGPQRNLLGYYSTTSISRLVAYCVADKEFLEEYLIESGWITHIGSRRRQGHGQISNVKIESDPNANELWKKRVKPFALDDSDTPIFATCSPPYWDKTKKQSAFIPITLI
jgi:CRISPR type IV-associated protein Csf3